jgi:Acyclic terpene utilisation family protein AtuA
VTSAVRIGCGAGFSGDRIEPAIELAEHGRLDYLVFECLAERTIGLAQHARMINAAGGFDPLLDARMRAVLPLCLANGTRIITNMGAANPRAAAARIADLAREHGWRNFTIAAVTGDDVLPVLLADRRGAGYVLEETGQSLEALGSRLISANAYLGAAPIVEALRHGADVVITGRVADAALFLAAQIVAFDWSFDDWQRLGRGTLVGHLLECAGQITGGYFADPECLPVPGLSRLGFPLAEVHDDGSAVITKVPGSGGVVNLATCKAQLLYEVHDPAAYLTPDVIADFSEVQFAQLGTDRVQVSGGDGRQRPDQLKVSVGYRAGFFGEGQISYAGDGAQARATLALEIVRERLTMIGAAYDELRCDLIGVNAMHGAASSPGAAQPYEVRVRVAARTASAEAARAVGNEVEALYTNGPAGGGGAFKSVREILAIGSLFVAQALVQPTVHYEIIP